MDRVQQDRPPNNPKHQRGFPPYSQELSLAIDWVLEAPTWARPYRVNRAALRLAELLHRRAATIAVWIWSMVSFDTLKKLGGVE